MNIVLWPTYYLPSIGGIEVMTYHLATELKQAGHNVMVVSSQAYQQVIEEKIIDGIPVYLFPLTHALLHHDLAEMKQILCRIDEIIRAFQPTLIHLHGWFECMGFYQIRILQKIQTPFVITIHGLLEQKHYQTPACMALFRKARAVSVVSEGVKHDLENRGLMHPKLQIIYNGMPLPTYQSPPWQPSHRLLMVGRLGEEKGFDILFHALPHLIPHYPTLHLTLVGGGMLFEKLQQLRHELQLQSAITMTDFVKPMQVASYMDDASIVVIPSYYESFCLVALEAAMRKRPVIGHRLDGLQEVVLHGKTGLLVDTNQKEAYIDAIHTLFQSPEKAKIFGENAYQHAIANFSMSAILKQYLHFYQVALREPLCPYHASV